MKLLTRTTVYYSLFSLPLLALAAWGFYYILLTQINDSLDESLSITQHIIEKHIQTLKAPTNFIDPDGDSRFDYFQGTPSFTGRLIRDTSIYDSMAHEHLPYRLLNSTYVVPGGYYEIKIKKAAIETEDLAKGVTQSIVLLFFILLIGLAIMNWSVTRHIWKPFYNTIYFLKNHKIGIDKERLPEKTLVSEFNDLNNSLNEMIRRADADYHLQKEFTENASHEMQTPVAVMRSKIDLLIQSQNLREEEMQLIHSMANALKRLSHLHKSLLLLSKIENRQFQEKENINIRETVETSLEMYAGTIHEKGISVLVKELSPLNVEMNRGLSEILVNNLIQNALRHNIRNGTVHIELNQGYLLIANTGSPLKDDNDIFKRFNKSNLAIESVGLGLAITKEIIDASDLAIAYSYHNEMHHFTIQVTPQIT